MQPEDFFEDEFDLPDVCERCNCCSTYFVECGFCGGEGGRDGDDLMEEDPLWYGPDDYEECSVCKGKGGFAECVGHCDDNGKHHH